MQGKLKKLKDNAGNYVLPVTHTNAVVDENGKTLTQRLSEIGTGGSIYTLPTASATILGGVKVGTGLSIDPNGILSASGGTASVGTTEHYKGLLSDYVTGGTGVFGNDAYIKTTLESGIYRVLNSDKPPQMNPPFNEDFILVHQKMFTNFNWAFQYAYPISDPSKIFVRRVLCGSPYTDGRQGKWKYIGENAQVTSSMDKKLLTMGDSLTANWGGGITDGIPKTFPTDPNGYQPHIIKRLGIQVYSIAYGGSKMARINNHLPYDDYSFHKLATTFDFTGWDYITIAYGTNDSGWLLPLGGVDSTDPYTVQGAMNVGIEAIYASNPNAQLFFITPPVRADHTNGKTTDQQDYEMIESYGNAIKEVCAKYDLPVFDGLKQGGINLRNYPTMLNNDKLHISNPKGYDTYGARIAEWLKQYI